MEQDVIGSLLADHRELLTLPHTLAEVLRVSRKETSSARELADVILKDPALTARLLRVVNSPFYGVRRQIGTMSEAVVTLGTRAVTAFAMSASVYRLTANWATGIDRPRFWRHSLEVAIACRLIAEAVRYRQPEEAYIAGLLHDVGMLVLESAKRKEYATIAARCKRGDSLSELEDELWGTNHARVGKFLLEQWHLPANICDAIGRHHTVFPEGTSGDEHQLPQIVALANKLSRFLVFERERTAVSDESLDRDILAANLGLPPETIRAIHEQLFTRTVEEARYLEMEIGSTEELLTEANNLLFQQYLTVESLLRENRVMQKQIARDQMKKMALESVKTITATFHHYVNNATATILGRAQLLEFAVSRGSLADPDGSLRTAIQVITGGVNTIGVLMEELRNLSSFDATSYDAETYILDIELRIKEHVRRLEQQIAVDKSDQVAV